MQKRVISLLLLVFLFSGVSAASDSSIRCNPTVQLISQDPYPAVPGDYVKLLFQISGVSDSSCGGISIELAENYPISFDPGESKKVSFLSGTFVRDYQTHKLIAYQVRVDKDAMDGENPIEILISSGASSVVESKKFNLNVEDVRADFDVFVKSYDYSNNRLVLEILNTAKNDVKAITVRMPKQENIKITGSNQNIVGDLDSNDYTSRDFTAVPKDGKINLEIEYTDITGKRRTVEKEVLFESEYFTHTKSNGNFKVNFWMIAFIALLAFFLIRDYRAKKKKK